MKSCVALCLQRGQLDVTDDAAEFILRVVFQSKFRNLRFRDTMSFLSVVSLKGG